jgi:DNA-binding MarR family transcriptional regulator
MKEQAAHNLTMRDLDVLSFIEKFKCANLKLIQELFFPSRVTCERRLKILVDGGVLKRVRDSITMEYIYYTKLPKQAKHALAVANIYAEMCKKYKMFDFCVEPVLGSIRPDAMFGYTDNGIDKVGLLEVELSHKTIDIAKYRNFIRNGESKAHGFSKFTLFLFQKGELKSTEIQ